jgi:hypothetical protein
MPQSINLSPEERALLRIAEQNKIQPVLSSQPKKDTYNWNQDLEEMVGMPNSLPETVAPVPTPEGPAAPPAPPAPADPIARLKEIASALKEIDPNAPSFEQLLDWKNAHGGVFLQPVDDDQVFIFRYLKRIEWTKMNTTGDLNNKSEDEIDEVFFKKCVLWPKPDEIRAQGLPAGTISMLAKLIQHHSNFRNPELLAQATVKL